MKAFTVKTTIAGNEEQVEQVFASTTRLALQRAIYAIYEKTPELTTGESRSMTISCQRSPYTKPMAQLHHHAVRVRSQEFHDKVKLALIDRDMVGDIMATKEGIVVGSIIASSSNKNLIRLRDERVSCENAINFSRQERMEKNTEKQQGALEEFHNGHPERSALADLGLV